jgi:hypothetical protein
MSVMCSWIFLFSISFCVILSMNKYYVYIVLMFYYHFLSQFLLEHCNLLTIVQRLYTSPNGSQLLAKETMVSFICSSNFLL